MNTNQLKKFAQEARRELLKQVAARLDHVLKGDTPELREKSEQVKSLKEAIDEQGKEQLIDKVAYTWFNRLVALRFMDVNDYQPLGIRVITPQDGFTIPELLQEARQGHIPEELQVDKQRVSKLMSGSIPAADPQNEAYRLLFIASCNHLNKVFPFLFESINDWMELLLPDDLISELSVLELVRNGMTDEDCQEVEIIGWLYQFYISEKKDAVFAAKGKVKKEDIPAVTQLFTPRWIVEYMVQNTLGKLWLQNRPSSRLREHMSYYIESPSTENDDYLQIDSVEEIKLLDHACGSGHILVYAFDLFWKIYEEEGYNTSEISRLIIEKNLYGFEIDERAAQLSSVAILMEARSKSKRLFIKEDVPKPSILQFQDLKLSSDEIKSSLEALKFDASEALKHDLMTITQATNLGSLIQPHSSISELTNLHNVVVDHQSSGDVFLQRQLEELLGAVRELLLLSQKYDCVVANPPYMGGRKMNTALSEYVNQNYPFSKTDTFACFIEKSLHLNPEHGFSGLVTMESWMFLSSFEGLRNKFLKESTIHSLSHFGWHVMNIAFGTVAFILENSSSNKKFKGTYSFVESEDIHKENDRPKVFPVKDNGRFNVVNQKDFEKIPGSPIGYWLGEDIIQAFQLGKDLKLTGDTRQGMATSDNQRFIKFWFEVDFERIGFEVDTHELAKATGKKWFPYNKGGAYGKWYGNHEYVVNWENGGEELLEFAASKYGSPTRTIKSISEYFKPAVSWSKVTGGAFSVRFYPKGFLFDVAGCCIYFKEEKDLKYVLGFLNSKPAARFLQVLSPTINYEAGSISRLPLLSTKESILTVIDRCVIMSISAWDSNELSWNFSSNPVISMSLSNIEGSIEKFCEHISNELLELVTNEESVNGHFIEEYGLSATVSPDVSLNKVTIYEDAWKLKNGDIHYDYDKIASSLISYVVGCIFGRYAVDSPGLILSSQGENLDAFSQKTKLNRSEISFLPDEDNIVPLLEDEWFTDDITGRFYEFLKVTFNSEKFSENLAFVKECIGKDIRSYFLKDFYNDHIKRYKKRPIYWMFSSEKGAFNVLIYMHRYTSDTLNIILNDYLRPFIDKLKNRVSQLEHIEQTGEGKEKTRALKEMDKLQLQIKECETYERDILYPIASKRIEIDLDDGVLVNYNKFGKAVKEVKGLNDKKTKDKVRGFDWIDATQII